MQIVEWHYGKQIFCLLSRVWFCGLRFIFNVVALWNPYQSPSDNSLSNISTDMGGDQMDRWCDDYRTRSPNPHANPCMGRSSPGEAAHHTCDAFPYQALLAETPNSTSAASCPMINYCTNNPDDTTWLPSAFLRLLECGSFIWVCCFLRWWPENVHGCGGPAITRIYK